MSLKSKKLNPLVGSEVFVARDELLTADTAAQMRALLVERGVLLLRELGLTQEEQLQLSQLMGTVREEGNKGVLNITIDPKLNSKAAYLKGSFLWHIDGTHDSVPPFASFLTGITLADEGGQTEFANTYAAYEALPEATKTRIDKLQVVHSVEVSTRRGGVQESPESRAYWQAHPDTVHNLVWTHKTGRKSLVIGSHASHVVGMDRAEGEQLLQELLDWTTHPQFVYRHAWRVGDLLIWDNTGVMHRVEPYAMDCGRLMRRTTLVGEEPFA